MKRPTRHLILRRVNYWKKRLFLRDVKIVLEFGPDPDPEEASDAACLAMPEYLEATLRFDLERIPLDEVDSYVVHELCHIPIWPLSNYAHAMCADDPVKLEVLRNHEEELATRMERIIISLTKAIP